MMRWRSLLALLMLLASFGCSATTTLTQPARPMKAVPNQEQTFLGGTAIADITPPLHLALFGHGPEGRVAAGVRTRLRCQVFVLASQGEAVALVPCDLQSPSFAVQHDLAAALRQRGVPLSADRIFLMATHTHAAPGHYFDAHHYTGNFSSPLPGYDPEVKDLFVSKIASAIEDAFETLAPVCLGFKVEPLRGLTLNRAYPAFLSNDQHGAPPLGKSGTALLQRARDADRRFAGSVEKVAESEQAEVNLTGPEVAVDNQLSVLRIDRQNSGVCAATEPPLGVLAVYGMHPTGVPNTNDLYHGDIFGFATRTAATCLRGATAKPERPDGSAELWLDEQGKNPCADDDGPAQPVAGVRRDPNKPGPVLVGVANGVEGDVSPNVPYQSMTSARQLGRLLGVQIARTAASIDAVSPTGTIAHFYRELHFVEGRYDANATHQLCSVADLGMSSAGGARDGPTRVRIIPEANQGFRLNQPYDCQGYKMPLRVIGRPSKDDFPTVGPIALLHVRSTSGATPGDSFWLGTLPLEATTMTGFNIRDALAAAASGDNDKLHQLDKNDHVALVGLTNQYFQYVATKTEYDFQFYEGASTLYGPHSAEFLAYQFACLAKDAKDGVGHCDAKDAINTVGTQAPNPAPAVTRMAHDENEARPIEQNLDWRRNNRGGALGWEMEFPPLPLTFTKDRNLLRMELWSGQSDGKLLDDDQGSSFELHEFLLEQKPRWRVRWMPYLGPDKNPICGQVVRLVVRGRYHFESKPFQVDCAIEKPNGGTL